MTGKCQANIALSPYLDFWALNAMKMMEGRFLAQNGSTADTSGNWQSLLNDDGYPTEMYSTTAWKSQQLYIYGVAGDIWVLDWQGDATLSLSTNGWLSGGMTANVINANRVEYTLTGDPNYTAAGNRSPALLVALSITAIPTSVSNIRLYRKEHEALINGSGATSIFNPDFLARVSGFNILRFMDWLMTNQTRLTRWQDRRALSNVSWNGYVTKASHWFGSATQVLNKYTVSALPELNDGQPVAFMMPDRPTLLTVATVTVGNPTTIQFTAPHGLSTGDKIQVDWDAGGGGSWNVLWNNQSGTGLPPDFAVTVTAPDTVTIPFDSTGFSAPGVLRFHPIVQISDGTQTKKCYRKGMTGFYNSEWGGATYPREMCAVYNADFDAFIMSGNGSGDLFYTGVPFEAIITLCNHVNANPHLNIPFVANADFAMQLAALVKDTLSSGLVPLFEKGNEIWNTGTAFWSTSHAANYSLRNYASSSSNLGYAKKVNETSDAISAVFGSRPWDMGFGVQGGAPSWLQTRWEGNATINGSNSSGFPINKVDVILIGSYIVVPWGGKSNAASYSGLADAVAAYKAGDTATGFNWMRDQLDNPTDVTYVAGSGRQQDLTWWTDTQIPYWQGKINTGAYVGRTARGLRMACYEGGQGCNAGTGATSNNGAAFLCGNLNSGTSPTLVDTQAFWKDFMVSSQMGEVMQRYCRRFLALGVVPSQYFLAGPYDLIQNWGAYRYTVSFYDSPSPCFTMLKLNSSGKRRVTW